MCFIIPPQVSGVQKLETKQIQLRETYEKQKMDVQNLNVEKKQLDKHLDAKVNIFITFRNYINPNVSFKLSKFTYFVSLILNKNKTIISSVSFDSGNITQKCNWNISLISPTNDKLSSKPSYNLPYPNL